MNHFKIFTVLGFMLITTFTLSSEEIVLLDIDKSIQAALEQNKSFMITALQTESSKESYDNRWNSLIPSLTLSSGLDYRDTAISGWNNSSALSSSSPVNFSAGLSLSLPLNTSLIHKIEQTRLDYEASQISYETAQRQLIRDVEKEFYYLLAIQTNLEVLEQNLELAEKRYLQTVENFNNGFASELQVLQAQVTASNSIPQLSQARSDYDTRQRNFLILLGMDPEEKVQIQGNLEKEEFQADSQILISSYISSRQDILSQHKQIESLENQKKTARSSGFSPNLTLSGGWSTAVNDPFLNDSWLPDTWSDTATVGMSLRIPLDGYIPGSSQKTAVSQTQNKIDQAQLQLEALNDGAKTEILNLTQQISTSLEQVRQAGLNVTLAQKSYELTEESYNMGSAERLDVEDAQQSFLEAMQQQLSNRYLYLSALIDLKYALNLDALDDIYKLN